MISALFKFPLYFAISFILLSIPINSKTLFYHIDDALGPMTTQVHKQMKRALIKGHATGKEFIRKVFLTNAPDKESLKIDRIQRKNSGISLEESIEADEYTPEDRELLQSLLENSDI